MKLLARLIILIVGFVGVWLLLAQVNWLNILGINQVKDSSEQKLSEFVKEQIERTEEVIKDPEVNQIIDSLLHVITKSNSIDHEGIKVMVVKNDQINAYALPTDYMVINSGLIEACSSPEALTGVMAHELSHIELNHVKRKLLKELGVAVLVSSTSGGGGEVVKQVTKTLSSTAYDRSLEEEADEMAVTYMIKADIDPEPLAGFFYQLSLEESEIVRDLDWISTHTNSKERSEVIVERLKNEDYDTRPVIHPSTWKELKTKINQMERSY